MNRKKRKIFLLALPLCLALLFSSCEGGTERETGTGEATGEATVSEIRELIPDFAELSLTVGEEAKLSAKASPAGAEGTWSWSSGNAAVATVTEDGTVKGITRGKCRAICTSENGVSVSVPITVNPKPEPADRIVLFLKDDQGNVVRSFTSAAPSANETVTVSQGEKYYLASGNGELTYSTFSLTSCKFDPATHVLSAEKIDNAGGIVVRDPSGSLRLTLAVTVTEALPDVVIPAEKLTVNIKDSTGKILVTKDSTTNNGLYTLTLHVGDSVTLEGIAMPENTTEKTVTYTKYSLTSCSFDQDTHVITAKSVGDTGGVVVKAAGEKYKLTVKLIVED